MASGLRERNKQRRRQAIVDAAVDLFRERGFDETRVQDILDRADVSLGTFYNYFRGKDAVLDEFGAGVIASYVELARHELESPDEPVADRVRALARACGRAFSSDPAFMAVVATRSRAFGGGGQLPAEGIPPIYGLLSLLFDEGQREGEIRADVPPLELAQSFSGTFMFTVVGWLMAWQSGQTARDAERDLERRLMRAFDVFLDGCRRTGSASSLVG
jgi:AcrR family transcriptional regulator